MEIIKIRNNHIKPESEYGCVCAKCGTSFIFKEHEIDMPLMIYRNQAFGTIKCPNCLSTMSVIECKELTNDKDRNKFIKSSNEYGGISPWKQS